MCAPPRKYLIINTIPDEQNTLALIVIVMSKNGRMDNVEISMDGPKYLSRGGDIYLSLMVLCSGLIEPLPTSTDSDLYNCKVVIFVHSIKSLVLCVMSMLF